MTTYGSSRRFPRLLILLQSTAEVAVMVHSLAYDSPKATGAGCQCHEWVTQGFLAQFQVLGSDPDPLWYASVILAAVEPVAQKVCPQGSAHPCGYWLCIGGSYDAFGPGRVVLVTFKWKKSLL